MLDPKTPFTVTTSLLSKLTCHGDFDFLLKLYHSRLLSGVQFSVAKRSPCPQKFCFKRGYRVPFCINFFWIVFVRYYGGLKAPLPGWYTCKTMGPCSQSGPCQDFGWCLERHLSDATMYLQESIFSQHQLQYSLHSR